MLTIKSTGFEEYLDPSGGAWIKALILGNHGSGKTRSSAFWPDPIIADCERGLMSVADLATPYATITSSKDMDDFVEYLRRDSMQPTEKRKHRTAIIDCFDSYQRVLISERLRSERKESLSGWADWGWLDGKMQQLIEKLLNLPINVVVNMHVKDEKDTDDESSVLVKKSALKGAIAETVYRDFDLIGLMETTYAAEDGVRVMKRSIRWHSEPKFPMLRDRSGRLPRFTDVDFTPADYDRIFGAITAGVDDLPATQTLQEYESDDEVAPATPDAPGGPVGNVKVPKAAVAKKAPAKKAAAKGVKGGHVTLVKDEPEVEETGTPVDAPKPEVEPDPPADLPEEDTRAMALVEDALGGEVMKQGEHEDDVLDVPLAEPVRAADEVPVAEGGETPRKAEAKTALSCGDVPAGLNGNPDLGCGTELTAQNAVKRAMAQLRTKTLLCDSCFEQWKSNN